MFLDCLIIGVRAAKRGLYRVKGRGKDVVMAVYNAPKGRVKAR
jgi:hypothetical protein